MAAYNRFILFEKEKPELSQVVTELEKSIGGSITVKELKIKIDDKTIVPFELEGKIIKGVEVGYLNLDSVRIWRYKKGFSVDYVPRFLKKHYLSGKAFKVLKNLGGDIKFDKLVIDETWDNIRFKWIYF